MKKLLSHLLLCACTIAAVLAFQRIQKHEKKLQQRRPRTEQLSMSLPAFLPVQNIHGQNREQIIAEVRNFPITSYQLFQMPKGELFYLDAVDDLIKGELKKGAAWEGHIQKLIRKHTRPGSTVLDIGAHIGTHTLTMARAVGPEGLTIAFEPQPKIFRELFWNMAVNNVPNISFYSAGVGDTNGNIELAPLNVDNEGGTSLLSGGSGQFVPLLTIDSLELSNVSLMKIDVEGMENAVLEGARKTIAENRPTIIIEIMGSHDFATASNEVRREVLSTVDSLEQMGYHVAYIGGHDWIATRSSLDTNIDN